MQDDSSIRCPVVQVHANWCVSYVGVLFMSIGRSVFLVFSFSILCTCTSCTQMQNSGMNKTAGGALTGSALGAGLGAIVGSQSGHAGPGVAIGAAAGALGGALLGNQLDQADDRDARFREKVNEDRRLIEENRRLIEELRSRGADVRPSSRGVVINLPDILFRFGSAELTSEAYRNIADIADVIKDVSGRNIAVEGHTDSIGSDTYNQSLSLRRANSVASALRSDGVLSSSLRINGFGESRPIAINETEAGRARNRRVEVVVEDR